MIATARYCDCNEEDTSWTATTADNHSGTSTDNTFYVVCETQYITYDTFPDIPEFDFVQVAIIVNRIRAQAILGYFADILPALLKIENKRKANRQHRHKRSLSIQSIIVMIAICLIFIKT